MIRRCCHALLAAFLALWAPVVHAEMAELGAFTKKFFTFQVVTVTLYLQEGFSAQDVLAEVPKKIDVEYHVRIPARELRAATTRGIRRNSSRAEFNRLLSRITRINAYYPDVSSGDRISILYIPGHGCEVSINGLYKGLVPGADFARAFFSIWIGSQPVDVHGRDALLGR